MTAADASPSATPTLTLSAFANRLRHQIGRVDQWWGSRSDLTGDALLYGASAIFAAMTWVVSKTIAESHWGSLAVWTYALAAGVAFVSAKRSVTAPHVIRLALLTVVVLGALVLPLALLSTWRSQQPGGNFAQPEVMVIERGANFLYHGHNPYESYWANGHLINQVPGVPPYESFYPYFPLLSVFGAPAALDHQATGLTDARVIMALVTAGITGWGLWLLRPSRRHVVRVIQFMLALPTGALFLATGGDDLPILSLLFLGVVFLQRRRISSAAFSIGVAAAMKLTAWPMLLGALLVCRDQTQKWRWVRYAAIVSGVIVVTVAPFFALSPHIFVANVIDFPAGLAHVPSPAASDLPGHLLVKLWAPLGKVLTPLTLVALGAILTRHIRPRWPIDLSTMLTLLAIISAVIIATAANARSGYVIYPMNFWLWAHITRRTAEADG